MDADEYNVDYDDERGDDDASVDLPSKDPKVNPVDDDEVEDEDFDDEVEDEDFDDDELDEDDVFNDNQPISEGEIANRIQTTNEVGFSDTDDDADEDNYEDYLQKFDEHTRKDIISEFHPEMQSHNYDEIVNMSVIVRDANGTPIDPLHKTLPMLTRYEKARILGERAKQLNAGAKPFVEVDETIVDGYLIALKELEEKKIPFIVKRPLPNGGCEYWKLIDLEVLV